MIDIARFYGLVLVYYGHVIERFMDFKDPTSFYHYKFIYSFHMPLFFLLAGYISKPPDLSVAEFFKKVFVSRIVPLIFFNLLLVVLSLILPGDFWFVKDKTWSSYLWGLARTAGGFPVFNIITWFFFMLISVEVLHFFVIRYIQTNKNLLIAALFFYLGGWLMNSKFQFFRPDAFLWNFWYMHEAVVVYSFYLVGIFLSRWKGLEVKRYWGVSLLAVVLSLLFVYITYDLNSGPFIKFRQAVLIVSSQHGSIFWFPITAVIGCLFILLLAKLTPAHKFILLIGANAPIVFPLNGFFYHFINLPAAKWIFANFSHHPLVISTAGSVVTVASLLFCIPCILFLNRYFPQLVGKPKVKGPIFKNFI